MESGFPVLVSQVADRKALTRLVRVALRHDIAQISLEAAPRDGHAHTLDLQVDGEEGVVLLAELVGSPANGQFPLRLRPMHKAHADELLAMLEEEAAAAALDPLARAMSGPPPKPSVVAMARAKAAIRRTAPMSWTPPPPPAPTATLSRTPPPPVPPTPPPPISRTPHPLPMSPPPPPPPVEAAAEDPSLSVSVVFEPDTSPAVDAGAPPSVRDPAPSIVELPPESGWANAEPSISVAVDFEPDMTPAIEANAPSSGVPVLADAAPDFFDDALASLPALTLPPDPMAAADTEVPVPPDDEPWGDDDADTLIRLPEPATSRPSRAPKPELPPMTPPDEATATDFELPVVALVPDEPAPKKRKKTTNQSSRKKKTGHPAAPEPAAKRSRPPPGIDPLLGRRIADGKYEIEMPIGSGAAGTVYRATHRELRRTVGIKVLHPHYQQDPHFMNSFRSEALAASQIDHPNVMRVLDFGQEPDGLVYIVMEFLSGRTLQSLLDEERRLPTDRAVEIMIQVCAALSVAHDNGIIHRDIKPDNIMLVPSRNDEGSTFELVKVCDFGIAALQNTREEEVASDGLIAGTPEYMSPEQARGIDIDARSDVYAAGICLYELVTGRPPFIGDNPNEILIKQVDEAPKPPSSIIKNLDPLLEEIVLRSIQKDPAMRPQSARELRIELKELIDPGEARGNDDEDERSIVESVLPLDDPGSGFTGFFMQFSGAILRLGQFERGHPEAAQAMKHLFKSTKAALRGRRELTFARRDTQRANGLSIGFCVVTGHSEITDLKRLLGPMQASHGDPFGELLVKKGIASLTIREAIPDAELAYIIEMLLGPHEHEELRKELFSKPLRHISAIFVTDVVGRDRKLTWKVGLCLSRLVRDLKALSSIRGLSLKKMRETRDSLVGDISRLLTKVDEIRRFLFNVDLLDESVANLRGFSAFQSAPLVIEHLHHELCAETAIFLARELDAQTEHLDKIRALLPHFATRLVEERSVKSDAAVSELYRRGVIHEDDLPRDLRESIRAHSLADALVRDPSQFLRMIDLIVDPEDYTRELATLEAAMAVLARRGEAIALLAAIRVLARHAQTKPGTKSGPRETQSLRAMKSMIDKTRLVPIAQMLLMGPAIQQEAASEIISFASSAGAHALLTAREGLGDMSKRGLFVQMFRDTDSAGWSLLAGRLPAMDVSTEADIALVEDLLRAMPDHADPQLGEAAARFLGHPRLRAAALAVIGPLLGDKARRPLLDALEFAEEPARIVAVCELRRMRAVDEQVVNVIERLLTMRGMASEELRAAAAAALVEVPMSQRARAVALLTKSVEGKRGLVAMIRGDGGQDESLVVLEAMARALLTLDRVEGTRAIKARISRADAFLRARLVAVLTS